MTLTFLGSGTSTGVPIIPCQCPVCTSTDPHDKRLRPSVLLEFDGRAVVIDTTPDFRTQALRAGMTRLDAVLFTHGHADHIMGLDDTRVFYFRQQVPIPIYANAPCLETLHRTFRRCLSVTPLQYRARFSAPVGAYRGSLARLSNARGNP